MSIVLITGGSGLIGMALTQALSQQGHTVRHLGRKVMQAGGIRTHVWDISKGTMDTQALDGVDHIVHLAGARIADERWTPKRVRELIDSRAKSASLLLREARKAGLAPKAFVSAAGVGYHGAVTSDHRYTEADAAGTDTIGRISREWEAAVDQWGSICRVVKLRTPMVLAREGGAVPRLARIVRHGLGAPLGTGRQWMPWVHLHDLVEAYMMAMHDERMHGAYNVCAPEDTSNADMMRTLAHVLGKPFFLPAVPGLLLKVVLGEMSSILLKGSRVSSERLLGLGFRFRHTGLESALRDVLAR